MGKHHIWFFISRICGCFFSQREEKLTPTQQLLIALLRALNKKQTVPSEANGGLFIAKEQRFVAGTKSRCH